MKSYWKPAGLRCKVLLGLLQSEKPESWLSRGGLQGTGAGCSLLRQTRLLPNLLRSLLYWGITLPDVEGCTHVLQEGLLSGKGF